MNRQVFQEKVLPLFTITLVVTFIGSFIGFAVLPIVTTLFWVLIGVSFVLFILLIFWKRNSIALLLTFNFVEGLTLTPLLYLAIAVNPIILPEALGLTSLAFGIVSFYSYKTKKNFLSLGPMLFAVLIVFLVLSIIQIFVHSEPLAWFIDIGIVFLFLGFVAYDTQRILKKYSNRDVVPAVVALYLDFINIFVRIVLILIRLQRREE